ncbi:hypothetical protein AMK26_21495 [Streptomyces sp. CB03234]|uniref:hypothetical protein n=1 Tax=Streptomyces sp. (strain CB03234) TaxID=1703937 RepID=UPI00093EF76B|nr:hypothetical protein [Streptomyces sp. CB03234]OKK02257.1 hypothetical protein AMK26_21495 [Streptomyces sp. CB03234]
MTANRPPVTVSPPNPSGGRSVHVDGKPLGLAHSVADLVDLLSGVGLELSPDDVATTHLIHWQGGGPAVWAESPP